MSSFQMNKLLLNILSWYLENLIIYRRKFEEEKKRIITRKSCPWEQVYWQMRKEWRKIGLPCTFISLGKSLTSCKPQEASDELDTRRCIFWIMFRYLALQNQCLNLPCSIYFTFSLSPPRKPYISNIIYLFISIS